MHFRSRLCRALAGVACIPWMVYAAAPDIEILERGAHHSVVRRVGSERDSFGGKKATVHTWVQLEDGLNYWDEEAKTWRESDPQIELTATGAWALRGQHRAIFSSNANDPAGALDLEIAHEVRLRSSVLALRYFDAATGGTVILATVQDTRGELLPPNQIIYRNVFDDVRADLVYTYRRRGVEADVVLREVPPSPADYGLVPETTRLEVVTEFFDPPFPQKTERVLSSLADPVLRNRVAEADWIDEKLDFGVNAIGDGRAFAWSAREAAQVRPEAFARVGKRWLHTTDGRTLLIESVDYLGVFDDLLDLPGTAMRREQLQRNAETWRGRDISEIRMAALRSMPAWGERDPATWDVGRARWGDAEWASLRRPVSLGTALEKSMLLASSIAPVQPGMVIDWATVTTGSSNFVFAATNTYLVTGQVTLAGTTTIEGGTVVKFPANGVNPTGVTLTGPVECRTSAYRPAVFTAESDNTVGETIVAGVPNASTDYGNRQLSFQATGMSILLEHLRMKHGFEALYFQGFNPNSVVRHSQFVNNRLPISSSAAYPVRLLNVLIHHGKNSGAVFTGSATPFVGEHLTLHQAPALINGGSLVLTNSIVAAITSVQAYSGSGNWQVSSAAGLFDPVGAGAFYLPAASALRNAGNPAIHPLLALDLGQLTTDAPRVIGGTFGIETNLVIQARRDRDIPDIGYHYAPLDFAVSGRSLVNGVVRLVDGVALGVYGGSGIILGAGARMESVGTASAPNRIAYFSQVQEQTVSSWVSPTGDLGLLELAGGGASPLPDVYWVFTEAGMPGGPANRRQWIRPSNVGGFTLRTAHSQLRGLSLEVSGNWPGVSLSITNTLFEDVDLNVSQSGNAGFQPVGLVGFNNLFRGGTVTLFNSRGDSPWTLQDNLFDPLSLSANGLSGTLTHNAFRAGLTGFGTVARTGMSMDYMGGPVGPYAYPTSGSGVSLASLINSGSRTATFAGLSPFTLRSDGAPETNSVVDIGFHYPAPAAPASGLVGYWRLDESAGATAADSSVNGFAATLLNGPVWTQAQVGNGLSFDGINDQATVADAPALRLTTGMTISFWVRKNSEISDFALYVGKGGPNLRNFAVWDSAGNSGKVLLQFQNPNGTYRTASSQRDLIVGRWYHVACTWDGGTGRIYLDGELDGTAAMPGPPAVSADPLVFGYAGYHGRLNGVLDEICLFNRPLSASEIQTLFQQAPPEAQAERRLGYWRFEERTGAVAGDSSGRGNNGTLTSGPLWKPGKSGNGLTFNGGDDSVVVPDAPLLRPTTGFTVGFWMNKSSEAADFTRIVGKGGPLVRNFGVWDVAGPSGKVMLQFQDGGGAYRTLTSSRELTVGTWNHVTCTWDGSQGRIYVDGVLDVSGTMAGPPATSADPLTFGYAGYHTYFPGSLDEVVLFDRALSPAEVSTLVATAGSESGMTGLLGSWRLNQSSGSTATDSSGRGFHGALSVGPQWRAGRQGGGLLMDGVSDWVTVPDSASLRPTSAFSLALWVKKDKEDADFVRYVGKGGPLLRNYGLWDVNGPSGAVMLQFQDPGGAYRNISSRRHLSVGRWYHVVGTWDGAVGRIFIDGELDVSGSMPGPLATSADPLTIGYAGYHARLAGAVDEVALYDRALSAAEVAALVRSTPSDGDGDGVPDATEDRNGNGVRDAGETSLVDLDTDYDGRSDAEERMDGTDPSSPRSVKPVQLGMWNFDNFADPWRGSNGSLPWERIGVPLVSLAPFVYGAEVNTPAASLRYRDVEANGRANINVQQGTVKIHYFPYWASASTDCAPGESGIGPTTPIELLSVGDFSVAIDGKGTNLMLRSPNPGGGYITNVQAKIHACIGEYPPDFPMEIQISYATNASALFLNGQLLARGSGIVAPPNRGSRAHGMFIGSSPDRTRQSKGVVDAVITYNVPLQLCTNATVMSIVVSNAPPSITLKWSAVTNCYYLIERRSPPQVAWQRVASATPPSYTDTTVVPGQEYEYRLSADVGILEELKASSDPGYLTMTSGLEIPPDDLPGHLLLVVDNTLIGNPAFAAGVTGLTRDLAAEGWVVARYDAPRHDDMNWANNPSRIANVKSWITSYRNANPTTARAVLLLGHLPIPRSGLLSPDGHKHRPLPTDGYYGDIDGIWTDVTNWVANPAIETPNLAGDGIFDQELIPANAANVAAVELAVGRVDFANMPAFSDATPSRGEVDLILQYLNKSRRYRRAEITVPERAIYGAYFSSNTVSEAEDRLGQHLAGLATRLGISVVGTNASGAVKADFLSANLPAVWGIQGGFAGGYTLINSRGPVNAYHGIVPHQTSDLLNDAAEPPIAFSLVEASWMPEWNAYDHFGRALLATRNYGYAWSYAGATRVEWQYPVMALGKTLGDAWLKTQNDAWMWPLGSVLYQSGFGTGVKVYFGERSQGGYVFTTLLGDPTLRQSPPKPPGPLSGQVNGLGQVILSWTASAEPNANYHVYRSMTGVGGAWTRITSSPLTSPGYTDPTPPPGTPTYCVRTVVLRTVASGTGLRMSAGSLWP